MTQKSVSRLCRLLLYLYFHAAKKCNDYNNYMSEISVIIPDYYVEHYPESFFISLLGQSFSDFELIHFDDGSTDISGKIAEEYAKKDSQIHVIHKQNEGDARTRNEGLRYINSPFVIWESDDNVFHVLFEIPYALQ